MNIAGLEMFSGIDYPGKPAAVVFTQGCNLDCCYCHNRILLQDNCPCYEETQVLGSLARRRKLLGGVVISGGEPTLQPDLHMFIGKVRRLGYAIKLDTNGTRPDVLKFLLHKGLLDFVAMDLKAPPEKFAVICGTSTYLGCIEESIGILLASDIAYEFRTTIIAQLSLADIAQMAKRIQGARKYVLQQYKRPAIRDCMDEPRLHCTPHGTAWFQKARRIAAQYISQCEARGTSAYPSAMCGNMALSVRRDRT